jgi:hypothetical protein
MRAAALGASVPSALTATAQTHGEADVIEHALSSRRDRAGAEQALEQAGPAGWTTVSVRDDWGEAF